MALVHIGAFILLMQEIGWLSSADFLFFIVILPLYYLVVLHGVTRELPPKTCAHERPES